ncbi:MAG: bifunctional 5,10-methylene-tetrahydrofolate dehydrogenase/5,10-methylene-tetrahydrofolate cyclohydrolase, partial [Bacteroidetes bacterium]|nr:bifunctional 5,10-methylene-tetrahydrofolate dehydrogenase/5,10-methylene-tetrahydrofolate cyclohydrolase [Bacteroidota bacterium]
MLLLDGKLASEHYKISIKNRIDHFVNLGYRPPHLVAVIVGNDGASET